MDRVMGVGKNLFWQLRFFQMGRFVVGALMMWIIVYFILSGVLMWLWNITITRIFGIREITYWEAFRLLIIAAILFGGGSGFNFN